MAKSKIIEKMEARESKGILRVNEIYPSFQGEGTHIGMPCTFLRLAVCNLQCTFCDTPFAWNFSSQPNGVAKFSMKHECHDTAVAEVVHTLRSLDTVNLVVSGGEPMLQQDALSDLLRAMPELERVEVETNGTIAPIPSLVASVSQFNVSPKLENSGNPLKLRYRPQVLKAYNDIGKSIFKFVASTDEDLGEIDAIVEEVGLRNVMLMPLGKTHQELEENTARVAMEANKRGWRFSPRLHIMLFGNARKI